MKNLILLSHLIKEGTKLKIYRPYGEENLQMSINDDEVNLRDFDFYNNPFVVCEEAFSALGIRNSLLDFSMVGIISIEKKKILFEYFHTMSTIARFSLINEEEATPKCWSGLTTEEIIRQILAPGWFNTVEDRLLKFELFCRNYEVSSKATLETVKQAQAALIAGIESQPSSSGCGHNSDNYEWHIGGLTACNYILARYQDAE